MPDEPMEVDQQMQRIEDAPRPETPPNNDQEYDEEFMIMIMEPRSYEIRSPIDNSYMATQEIPTFITDDHMATMLQDLVEEGFFDPANERSIFVTSEIFCRCIELQRLEIDRRTAEYQRKTLAAIEEREQAYKNRIRQPKSLLSLAGQVGPTQVNRFINNDLVGPFEIYLNILDRSEHYPLSVNILPRMAWHHSIKCFTLLVTKMNQWNETCHLEALKMRPGMGMVTSFWEITSMIMHAWGARKIIAWIDDVTRLNLPAPDYLSPV